VIEIAASDLSDAGAMRRHFRRLAGCLGAGAVRETVSKDSSWFERATEAVESPPPFALRLVRPTPDERFVTCVPLVPLQAAAGGFGRPQFLAEGNWDWVQLDTGHRLKPGMFVAQVVGKSMEPRIPDGSYCLFASPVGGSRQGRTVLVQLSDRADPETGQRYTVKRYESEKATSEDGTWRHVKITLRPNNPDFESIVLTSDDEENLKVVAELVQVLG
jgi:SOS-response transcriptional repressor LexA